ncbi:MAG: hypothetical protein ACD_49C00009G0027 [uncultured bacterium (gcode 4)]|uniref:Uncharacterized protein n=1 Tax=uncultured bacterium (gcode 4) TaxID=1234023 RepID=K2AYH7_9BACT|nr:MAG: hypothetical protein ACD_49C00009G0027 [uncultured bacterium (gcode 4)]
MSKKTIFLAIFYSILFSTTFYISWISWLFDSILLLAFYSILFYGIYFLYSKLRKRKLKSAREYLLYFYSRIAVFMLIILWFFWSLFYYENSISPAKLPEYTISNGKKIVKFQGMAHIWSDDFYGNIRNNVITYKKDWFVLFFEWVKPGNAVNNEKFNKMLGIKFSKQTYIDLSKLYWLREQRNNEFLWLVNTDDFNVDTTIDEIVSQYEAKYWVVTKMQNQIIKQETPFDVEKYVAEIVSTFNDREMKILIYVNRAIMNFIVKSQTIQDFALEKSGSKNVFDIILNNRNKILATEIQETEHKKMYVLYGLLHFKWVFNILQKSDPNWQIVSVKYYYPVK